MTNSKLAPPHHPNGKRDRRYSIARAFCGYRKPHWVVRFCGDWVGSTPGRPAALRIAHTHQAAFYEALGIPLANHAHKQGART